jgi:hypothetical protein
MQIYMPEWFGFNDAPEVFSRSGPPQPKGEMALLIYFMAVLRFRASRCVGHKKPFGKISIANKRTRNVGLQNIRGKR